jgi:hypothetical protein
MMGAAEATPVAAMPMAMDEAERKSRLNMIHLYGIRILLIESTNESIRRAGAGLGGRV